MEIRTQKDALTWGLEHWNCLAETGNRSKTLGFPAAHRWSGGCACCEYTTVNEAKGKRGYCGSRCLVKWKGGGCMRLESEFRDWEYASTVEGRRRCALVVALRFEAALNKRGL